MRRAVVTGPTGALGVALVNELLNNHIEVAAVCRPDSRRVSNLSEHELLHIVKCQLGEFGKLPGMLEGKYDIFYHLGWEGTFGNSRNDMRQQIRNIQYTLDAVEAAKQLGCTRFVGTGSQAEYGRKKEKLTPQTAVFPESGYGMGKLCAGQMSRELCECYYIEHVWVRVLSVYGAYDRKETLIMSTIEKLLKNEMPKLTYGEQMWDYLYSKDAAQALFLLGEKGIAGKTYVLGCGKARRLSEYVIILRDSIDPALPLGFGKIPYGEKQVMYLCADLTELMQDVGFLPQYTFEQGIKETIEWYKKNDKGDGISL